jgi:hypothetical protein
MIRGLVPVEALAIDIRETGLRIVALRTLDLRRRH